jgi:mRNA-degrading endonuclease RelE of RelBE toxin-antitoxin system
MIKFIFSKDSKKKFLNLEKNLQERVIFKLKSIKDHPYVFSILVQMKDSTNSTHRLRIGNYRIILFLKDQQGANCDFIIVDLGHRKEVYK